MRDLLIIPKKTVKRIVYYKALLLVVSAFLIAGCSKTKKEEEVATGEAVELIFKVEGVDSDISLPNLKSSAGRSNYVLLPEEEKPNEETFIKDDVFFAVKSDMSADQSGFEELLKPGTRSVSMENNTKYRLLVYTNANALVASIEVTTGQVQHISVTSGTTYKWYAYSYNTSASIPAPNTVNPVLTTPTSTPLLYASGTITPTALGTVLPILFKHQLTHYKVEVKESTGFRAILATTGEFSNSNIIKTGTFNILTGELPQGALTSANITTLNFVNETEGGVNKRVAHHYSADHGLATWGVKINSLNVQYTSTTTRPISGSSLPNDGYVSFSFGTTPYFKPGYLLKGTLEITFSLPRMHILPFSNAANGDGYRLGPNSGAGKFLGTATNFGPTSKYVPIKEIYIDPPTNDNLASTLSSSWTRFKNRMSDPATYPDVLVLANNYNYWDAECWVLINNYINRGGNVFYTQDAGGAESYAATGISNILGQSVGMVLNTENYTVYKFTDTYEALIDSTILMGPFGDVRNYHWGQDRLGASYVTGYTGNNVIAYSTHSQNDGPPSQAGMVLFRHKTKGFFFAGDGGFFLYDNISASNTTREPFRINSSNFPITAGYGTAATSNSPGKGTPAGGFTIANSMMFGNVMAWMLNRAHYYGINRN
ncbi:hypothetical protein [Sphingobacterium tabacisoli]|uniref:Uncharacterized protein n=1 Tax=Sphingobacterium tabacisoli TaxID=2044855 RepID=A0ABW5LAY6_9SPHI|nr:hypothetical protein [Sphingobacterium tabacisoli]